MCGKSGGGERDVNFHSASWRQKWEDNFILAESCGGCSARFPCAGRRGAEARGSAVARAARPRDSCAQTWPAGLRAERSASARLT